MLNERHGIRTRQDIDSPLVERPLASRPDDDRYRVQILRRDSIIECYVAEQVVASYRLYETSAVLLASSCRKGMQSSRTFVSRGRAPESNGLSPTSLPRSIV